MSKADIIFKNMCNDIIVNGVSSEGCEVRPHWEDGTPAHTIKNFGIANRYDLSEEFPALTLRKTYIKSAANEMLWIWQKKSNNIHDLKSKIWDEWASEDGSIGKAYGYQHAQRYIFNGITPEGLRRAFKGLFWKDGTYFYINRFNEKYVIAEKCFNGYKMTQIDKAIYDIVNNPLSRRIIVSMWNPEDLHEMNLEPCAYSMTFNVMGNKLNAILNQRSQDVLAANNWNVVQYAVLVHMMAQVTGYEPGLMVHVIADAHIYDRHIPIIKELLDREPFDAPKFELIPRDNFYDFTEDDILISDYKTHPQVDIPIAI